MKFLKNNKKIIAAFAAGVIITGGIGAYATSNYVASQVQYTENKTVAEALNDLYDKKKNYILPSGTKSITEVSNQIDVSEFQYADTSSLHTSNEVNLGKGITWNCGEVTINGPASKEIDVGFRPTRIFIKRIDSMGACIYDAAVSTSQFMRYSMSGNSMIDIGGNGSGFSSIGNKKVNYYSSSSGDVTWRWFAIKE